MTNSDPQALPSDIARVVDAAFGGQPFTEVASMSGGRSGAATFSLRVAGTRYVVRRGDPDSEQTMQCLQMASDRGVAPRLLHADVATGVTIMEHIDGAPVRLNAANAEQIIGVARTLRLLHGGPAFPRAASVSEVLGNMDGVVRSMGHSGLPRTLVEALGETTSITARFPTVPCHNDLNPGNVLQANGRVYFVDWDTAANHDPFFDLAEIGVFGCPSAADRALLLHEYLGRAPTNEEAARSVISRATALGFYSAAFGMVSALSDSFDEGARAVPMDQLLKTFSQTPAPPAVVAASLFAQMRQERASESYEQARRQLGQQSAS